MKKFLLLMAALLAACTTPPQQTAVTPPSGSIIRTADGARITPEALRTALSQADIVLIGERHDAPAHHQAEAWLSAGRSGSTLLEMLNTQQQAAVQSTQQFLQRGGYSQQNSLADKIQWNSAWDWTQYRGLLNSLLRGQSAVLPASPDRSAVQAAASFMPAGASAANPAVRKALAAIIGGQHGASDSAAVAANVSQQQYKDSIMAERLMSTPKPAWLIAGAVHTSKALGVPLYLKDRGYAGKMLVLILTDPDSGLTNEHADYIWEGAVLDKQS